jgi:hypothetical protein
MSKLMVLAALALAVPAAAQAQSTSSAADLRYCAALSDKYARYVGISEFSTRRGAGRGTAEDHLAVARCQEGDAASAIPVLERKLRDAKVDLPARE